MDVDNLLAGQRFDKELDKALAETDVFIAVIGPRWMELLAERQTRNILELVPAERCRQDGHGEIPDVPCVVEPPLFTTQRQP